MMEFTMTLGPNRGLSFAPLQRLRALDTLPLAEVFAPLLAGFCSPAALEALIDRMGAVR
jgi:hypothetical protein